MESKNLNEIAEQLLSEVSKAMADQIGREATAEELAERLSMTTEEVKDIMKMSLDALSVMSEGSAGEEEDSREIVEDEGLQAPGRGYGYGRCQSVPGPSGR